MNVVSMNNARSRDGGPGPRAGWHPMSRIRVDMGLSQRELAKRLGLKLMRISELENARGAEPTQEELAAVADQIDSALLVLEKLGEELSILRSSIVDEDEEEMPEEEEEDERA